MTLEIRKDNNALDGIKDLPLRQSSDLLPLHLYTILYDSGYDRGMTTVYGP